MKRVVLLIMVLFLLVDLAEDGCLGKANFYLPKPSAKTSISSCPHSGSGHTDFLYEFASTDLLESFRHSDTKLVTLCVPHTLQIIHCCHLSSSGGIPL
jgi:hypothetical protein